VTPGQLFAHHDDRISALTEAGPRGTACSSRRTGRTWTPAHHRGGDHPRAGRSLPPY